MAGITQLSQVSNMLRMLAATAERHDELLDRGGFYTELYNSQFGDAGEEWPFSLPGCLRALKELCHRSMWCD